MASEIQEDSSSVLSQLFPMVEHEIDTTSQNKIVVFTAGDVIANHALIMYHHLVNALKALDEYLHNCDDNDRMHGICSDIFHEIYDFQEQASHLYNSSTDMYNTIKTK